MSYKTYRMIQAFIGMAIGAIGGISLAIGNYWIIFIVAIIIGMAALLFLRRRVKEIVTDERTYAIAYKSSRLTLGAGGIAMALVGAVLLVLAHQDFSSTLAQVGLTLEYATCGLLVINYIAYHYYSRKMGGGD